MLSQMFKIFKCYGEEFNLNLNSLERTFGLCIWMPSLTNISNCTLEKKSFQGRPKTESEGLLSWERKKDINIPSSAGPHHPT